MNEGEFELEFNDQGIVVEPRPYLSEAEALIAQTFSEDLGRRAQITEQASEAAARENTIVSAVRAKLKTLARLGVMTSALMGVLPPGTVRAPGEASEFAAVSKERILSQVGDRPLIGLEQAAVLEPRAPGDAARRMMRLDEFHERPTAREAFSASLDSLPPSFLDNIEKISYRDELIPMRGEYGIPGSVEAAHANPSTYEIVFSRGSQSYDPFMLAITMDHEVCHLNAPDTHRGLNPNDRYVLYQRLLDRVQAPDRYRSSYVEAIKNADPKIELYRKASEYWAEICREYVGGSFVFPTADRALVQSLIDKTDPGFKEEARDRRRERDEELTALIQPNVVITAQR